MTFSLLLPSLVLKLPVISLWRLLQIISRELKAATTATSTKTSLENAHLGNGDYLVIIGLLQQTYTWYMVAGKLIVIPALGHQNKGKSSFTGSGLFVLMSQGGSNNELALQHVPCDRKFRNFTLSFGRLRQRILRKCVPHMQHDYFPLSTNQIIVFWRRRCCWRRPCLRWCYTSRFLTQHCCVKSCLV